jgi:hypothetical protein
VILLKKEFKMQQCGMSVSAIEHIEYLCVLRGTDVNKQEVDVQMDGGTQKRTPK